MPRKQTREYTYSKKRRGKQSHESAEARDALAEADWVAAFPQEAKEAPDAKDDADPERAAALEQWDAMDAETRAEEVAELARIASDAASLAGLEADKQALDRRLAATTAWRTAEEAVSSAVHAARSADDAKCEAERRVRSTIDAVSVAKVNVLRVFSDVRSLAAITAEARAAITAEAEAARVSRAAIDAYVQAARATQAAGDSYAQAKIDVVVTKHASTSLEDQAKINEHLETFEHYSQSFRTLPVIRMRAIGGRQAGETIELTLRRLLLEFERDFDSHRRTSLADIWDCVQWAAAGGATRYSSTVAAAQCALDFLKLVVAEAPLDPASSTAVRSMEAVIQREFWFSSVRSL